MSRERIDSWCERGIVWLALLLLWVGPVGFGAARMPEFLIVQGLGALALLLWLLRLWIHPRPRLFWPPACWFVLALVFYATLRYWRADVEYVARMELARVVLYGGLFLLCVNNACHRESIRLLVYGLVALGTLEAGYAAYQYLTHDPRIWGAQRPADYLERGSGTYICPNHLAGLLEMILPLALAFTVASRARPLPRILMGYGALMMAAGIALSLSRGGWISAGFGLLTLLALLARTARQWLALALFVVLLGAIGALLYSRSVGMQARLHEMRESLTRLDQSTRYGLASAAWRMWRDHPWFGVGPAHYDVRFRGYRGEHAMLQGRPGRAHNDYLNLLADWGLTGAALVLAIVAAVAFSLARHWNRLRRIRGEHPHSAGGPLPFLAGASAGLAALLPHSALDFNLHIPANAILAVVLLALLASQVRYVTDKHRFELRLPLRLAASGLLLVCILFLGIQGLRAAREEAALRRVRSLPELSGERIEALQRAFTIEPRNAETALTLAEQHRWRAWKGEEDYTRQADLAIEWYGRAAQLNPYDPLNPLGIAACLDWVGKYAEAAPFYRKALELDPNGHRVRAQMGWHYYLIEDYAASVEWFWKAFRVNQESPLARQYFPLANKKFYELKGQTKPGN